jgi:hypothetical protein
MTIVKLEFDRSVEELARSLPSVGSFTVGKERKISTEANGFVQAEVDLDGEKTIGRFEFTIDNPGHRRGQGCPFDLQAKQSDRSWKSIYKGSVYGTICGKQIDPVSTSAIRLVIQASSIRQLDLF